eukprot:COSAG02_NODE_2785_length_8032_cov_173.978066_2_plen_215_part_00
MRCSRMHLAQLQYCCWSIVPEHKHLCTDLISRQQLHICQRHMQCNPTAPTILQSLRIYQHHMRYSRPHLAQLQYNCWSIAQQHRHLCTDLMSPQQLHICQHHMQCSRTHLAQPLCLRRSIVPEHRHLCTDLWFGLRRSLYHTGQGHMQCKSLASWISNVRMDNAQGKIYTPHRTGAPEYDQARTHLHTLLLHLHRRQSTVCTVTHPHGSGNKHP